MLDKLLNFEDYFLSLGIFLTSLFFAIFVEFVLISKLRKNILQKRPTGGDYIVKSLKGLSFFLFLLLGLYVSSHLLPVDEKTLKWISRVDNIVLTVFITIAATRLATGIIRNYLSGGDTGKYTNSVLVNSATVVCYSIGIMIILEANGINITPILTALGVGGLAVALAMQDTLANLFAGLFIAMNNKLKQGDFIRLDTGEEGFIEDIGWRTTLLKEITNTRIVVPNTKLATLKVKNFTVEENELTMILSLGVSYNSDLEFVEKVTLEVVNQAMQELEGCSTTNPPLIRYNAFADFSINFNIIFRVTEYRFQFAIRHELVKRIHKKYKEMGIEIPFPIRTIINKNE
ncbi:MAG: mechanosensitive ion channel family protein [Cytophagales bacterium]